MTLLKQPCPCGDDRCKAFGESVRSTGHSRNCWDGCPTCARPKKSKPRSSVPSSVRRALMVRCDGFCEARTPACTGNYEHAHHRRRRSQGGRDVVSNLVAVCLACHGHIHAHPEESARYGLLEFTTTAEPQSSAVGYVVPADKIYDHQGNP